MRAQGEGTLDTSKLKFAFLPTSPPVVSILSIYWSLGILRQTLGSEVSAFFWSLLPIILGSISFLILIVYSILIIIFALVNNIKEVE